MDFAPVTDVNNNPPTPIIGVRSFSDDPSAVAPYAVSFIEGLHESGALQTVRETVGSPENHEIEWNIAKQAVTLLKNDSVILPLSGKESVLFAVANSSQINSVTYAVERLMKEVSVSHINTDAATRVISRSDFQNVQKIGKGIDSITDFSFPREQAPDLIHAGLRIPARTRIELISIPCPRFSDPSG